MKPGLLSEMTKATSKGFGGGVAGGCWEGSPYTCGAQGRTEKELDKDATKRKEKGIKKSKRKRRGRKSIPDESQQDREDKTRDLEVRKRKGRTNFRTPASDRGNRLGSENKIKWQWGEKKRSLKRDHGHCAWVSGKEKGSRGDSRVHRQRKKSGKKTRLVKKGNSTV